MVHDENRTDGVEYRDRKIGLVVFGILEIIMGAFCALMIPLILLSMFASNALNNDPASSMNSGAMIAGLLMYVFVAICFVWMGIGSILARRWARALVLVTSWIWLFGGMMGLGVILLLMPDMHNQMGEIEEVSRQIIAVIKYVMIGIMTIIYIVIPGVLILFYGSKHTKATCEQRDPHIRWTDKCPLPVLAVSLTFGCGAASIYCMGFYGWAMPFFGFILSGIAGLAIVFIGSLLFAYVAWGTYRLNIYAWWCAVLLILVWGISSVMTFTRVNIIAYYEKMGFAAEQLEMMKQMAIAQSPWMVQLCGVWVVVALVYLLYIRRFFLSSS